MSTKQTETQAASNRDDKKLLERIAKRYEQLDQKLDELEAKLAEIDLERNGVTFRPAKPR